MAPAGKECNPDTQVRNNDRRPDRIMEQEQERLQQLATKEQEDRGFLAGSGKGRNKKAYPMNDREFPLPAGLFFFYR